MSSDPIQDYLDEQEKNTQNNSQNNQDDLIQAYLAKTQQPSQFQPNINQSNQSFLQKAGNFVQPFNNLVQLFRLPEFSGGAIQGVYNTAKSAIDLIPQSFGSNYRLPEGNLEQYTKRDTFSNTVFAAGELSGGLTGGLGAYKAIGKGLKTVSNPNVFAKILQGAGTGLATGEDAPGGRELSAALGGGLSGAGNFANKFTNKSIANKAAEILNQNKNTSANMFNNVLENVPKQYAAVPEGNFYLKNIKKAFSGEKTDEINSYLESPSIKNAHYAQSSLGKKISELQNEKAKASANGFSFNKNAQLSKLIESQNSLKNGINSALHNINPDYLNQYMNAKKYYEESVAPFMGKGLENYSKNKKWSSEIVNNLLKNRAFMEGEFKGANNSRFIPPQAKNVEGLNTRKFIKDNGKYAKILLAVGGLDYLNRNN